MLVILGIISACFPREGIEIGSQTFYFPTIEDMVSKESGNITTASQRMKEMEESLRIRQHRDSVAYADSLAYTDSLAFYTDFFEKHPSRIDLPDNDLTYFDDLFLALDSCIAHDKVVNIMHYGDSQIEGDRISGTIRQDLQEKFGGKGPGVLPAVQIIPTAAVGQTASGNITRYIISGSHQSKAAHRRYGALGQLGIFSGEGLISVVSRNWKATYENVKTFDNIRLFVGQTSSSFKTNLILPDKNILPGEHKQVNSVLGVFSWKLEEPVKQFSLKMYGSGEIYGVAVDGKSGISMSNIPYRGSSGTFYTSIDSTLLSSMYKELNTRLILLEFGGNTVPYAKGEKAIASYKKNISNQIAYLRRVCPEAKIIFIGPADMSTKVQGKLQTYPHLENLIQALKEAALENGAAFWNMYEVMGGKDSMIAWVKNSPALASPDYIHFTIRGAERIGDLFFESLMIYYDYYTFNTEYKNKKE